MACRDARTSAAKTLCGGPARSPRRASPAGYFYNFERTLATCSRHHLGLDETAWCGWRLFLDYITLLLTRFTACYGRRAAGDGAERDFCVLEAAGAGDEACDFVTAEGKVTR
jgi:hypothetical protein